MEVLGKVYEISENVFNPKFYYTSIFMAKHIKVRSGELCWIWEQAQEFRQSPQGKQH